MLEPRKIPRSTVEVALKQAQHYRLLNEPALAESICRDIVAVDAGNQLAWITLLLSLTDQFEEKQLAFDQANDALEHLASEFHRRYYSGIIQERWARSQLKSGIPKESVDAWIRNAMYSYAASEELAPPEDPNPMLRWNTCARFLQDLDVKVAHQGAQTSPTRDVAGEYGDDVPFR